MSDKLQSVEIRIGSRSYPVKLSEKEMNQVSLIEKEINEMVSRFQLQYENLDHQDCISMALIAYAFDLFSQKQSQSGEKVIEKISQIQSSLDALA